MQRPAGTTRDTPDDRFAAALAHHRAGRLAEAEALYRAVLDAAPRHADALHLWGVAAYQRGDAQTARERIERALAETATVADYHANHGLALHALGLVPAAAAAYRKAIALREAFPEAHNSLGSALQDLDRAGEAVAHHARALALRADYPEAMVNLAAALRTLDRFDEAQAHARAAVALDPTNVGAHATLGVVLKEGGRLREADSALAEALRLAPGDAEALVNLGLLREAQGRLAEAEACYREALAGHPGLALARWNLALLLLNSGRLDEGWREHEARFAAGTTMPVPPVAAPVWQGEDPAGLHVLVWREQGLGDTLMFGSALPELAESAGRLTVVCDRRLTGLLGRSLPGVRVVGDGDALPADADRQVPIGSLPLHRRRTLADFPARPRWLKPEPGRLMRWQERLGALGPGLRVGLCWRSRVTTGERKHAYTTPAQWAPLFAVPGLVLVSLQYDARDDEIAEAARHGGALHRWPDADLADDLETAAALTAGLDLVITVATSVGEMAGALGVPVWRITAGRDWTRLGTGARPWFPTMRTWAPRSGEGMDDALAQVAKALCRLMPRPAETGGAADPAALLGRARALHAEGRGAEAERVYQRVLAVAPAAAEALHAYGRLGREAGRPDIAAVLVGRAAAVAPTTAVWRDLAQACQALGALGAADHAFAHVLEALPGDAEALGNRGAVLLGLGRAEESAAHSARALARQPDWDGLHANHALALLALGLAAQAARALARALALNPGLAEGWNIRAHAVMGSDPHTALACVTRALRLRPDFADAHGNRGLALLALGDAEGAVASQREALRRRPDDPAILSNLALALAAAGQADAAALVWWRRVQLDPGAGEAFAGLADLRAGQGRAAAAIRAWGRALAARPGRADWCYNLGNALHAAGRPAEADAAYRRAVEIDPGLSLATFNRGYAALARGETAAGWAGLEARFAAGQALPDRRFVMPRWDGGDLGGRTVLVWREQGVGDELMFASCYGDLIARAGRVVIESDPRLVGLFARSFPAATVRAETAAPHDADVHVPAGSLPGLFRGGLAAYPPRTGWLIPESERLRAWRGRLADLGPGLRIGIAWRSRLRGAGRDAGHVPLDRWGALLRLPGVVFVNLQYDDCEGELTAAERAFGVTIHRWPDLDLMNDLEGAAALTAALDLVVSAGTSVAEMAGALGVPVWRFGFPGEWTALGTAVRPWYPAMRLWSPRPGEELAAVLQRMALSLISMRPGPERTGVPENPAQVLERAVGLHRAGRIGEAEELYRRVLVARPRDSDALHLLGMIAAQGGRHAEAVDRFAAAIAVNRRVADYHANHAFSLQALGRHAEAAEAARRSLRLDNGGAEAANTLGNALLAQGRHAEALAAYRQALARRRDYAEAELNCGVALRTLGRKAEAEPHLRRALGLDPRLIDAAHLLTRTAHTPAARRILHALAPAHAGAWNTSGLALKAEDRITEAAIAFRRAIRIDSSTLSARANLGDLRRLLGRPTDAAALHRQALAIDPAHAGSWTNAALVAQEALGEEAAAAMFSRAVQCDPGQALARFNRALLRLRQGRVAEGWADYESRFDSPQLFAARRFAMAPWRGENPAGLRLLVWREQGLGDELMFGSCYGDLAAHAGHLVVECDRRLVPLFARSLPGATVRAATVDPRDADRHVPAGSLPIRLRASLSAFPCRPGWLVADPERTAGLRRRLDALGPGLKVGIAWTSRRVDITRRAAYAALERWAPLLAVSGVDWVSLQYDGRADEIAAAESMLGVRIHRFGDLDLMEDLDGAAALTAGLDLVVSVASSVGEMAGALGVPVWRIGTRDWTQLGAAVRPWYPTMRLIQPRPGEGLDDAFVQAAALLRRLSP